MEQVLWALVYKENAPYSKGPLLVKLNCMDNFDEEHKSIMIYFMETSVVNVLFNYVLKLFLNGI